MFYAKNALNVVGNDKHIAAITIPCLSSVGKHARALSTDVLSKPNTKTEKAPLKNSSFLMQEQVDSVRIQAYCVQTLCMNFKPSFNVWCGLV